MGAVPVGCGCGRGPVPGAAPVSSLSESNRRVVVVVAVGDVAECRVGVVPDDFEGTLPVAGPTPGSWVLFGFLCMLPLGVPAVLVAGPWGLVVFAVTWLVGVVVAEVLTRPVA